MFQKMLQVGSGGGEAFDFMDFDVAMADLDTSSSKSITLNVRKKPRYVVISRAQRSSAYYLYNFICDIKNDKYRSVSYTSSGYVDTETAGLPNTLSVTDTTVTYTNPASQTHRCVLMAWY